MTNFRCCEKVGPCLKTMAEEISKNLAIVKHDLNLWTVQRLTNANSIKGCKKEFTQVTEILSKFLPKVEDQSLYEIDDILYPGQDYKVNEDNEYVSESQRLNEITNISTYLTAHRYMLDEKDIFLDNTVLKFLKYIQCDLDVVYGTVMTLLCSGNARKVCVGLRMFKIVLESKSSECYKNEGIYSLLVRLKDITEAKEPNKKKMSIFISKLATECRRLMGDEYVFPKIAQSDKKIIVEIIHNTLYLEDFLDYYTNFFYMKFVSLEKEAEKRKYLEYILRGIISYSYGSSLRSGFSTIIDGLLYNITSFKSESANKELRSIDSQHGSYFKYLDNIDVAIDSKKVWSDEVDVKDETDYTFEKFFFYDRIIKNLHLLTIFYSACAECNKLCEDEFDEKDYTDVFSGKNFLMEYIAFFLNNRDLVVPWHIEKTMQMCPFLLFPLEHKDLVIGLIKYLRGEEVPDMGAIHRNKIQEMKSFRSILNDMRQKDLPSFERR